MIYAVPTVTETGSWILLQPIEKLLSDIDIRVVVSREKNMWVAQCLEYDIAEQASTLGKLCMSLSIAIKVAAEISKNNTGKIFGDIPPAPQVFFRMWENSDLYLTTNPYFELYNEMALRIKIFE